MVQRFNVDTITPLGFRLREGYHLPAQPEQHHDGTHVRRVRSKHTRMAGRNHFQYVQVKTKKLIRGLYGFMSDLTPLSASLFLRVEWWAFLEVR